MVRAISLLLAFFVTLPLYAKDVLVVTQDGYHMLQAGPDGPVLVEFDQIVHLDGEDPTDPTDPQPDGDVEAKVTQWTAEVGDPTAAKALSMLYRLTAGKYESGDLTREEAQAKLQEGREAILLLRPEKKDQWGAWAGKVSNLSSQLAQEGKLGTKAENVQFLRDVSQGLELSTAGILQDIDWQQLIEFIMLIIQLFA